MKWSYFIFVLLLGAMVVAAGRSSVAAEPAPLNTDFQRQVRPLLQQFCFQCHSGDDAESELNLQSFQTPALVLEDRSTWHKVLAKLQTAEMPPKDEKQPTARQRSLLVQWVDDVLNDINCSGEVNPGRVTMRRLNRVEYRNTVRDLLGVDYRPADDFPADDVGYGFDNIGDVLSLPPLLMEKYLAAAEQITAQAIVTRFAAPLEQRYPASKLRATRGSHADDSGERILTTNGEMFLEVDFPEDGQYRLTATAYGDQAGPEPVKMALRVDGRNLKIVEVKNTEDEPTPYTFTATVKAGRRRVALAFLNDYYRPELPRRENRDRNLIVLSLEIAGPTGFRPQQLPANHRRIFIARPGDELSPRQAARKILRRLASRAYRRQATEAELDRLLVLVELARGQGDNFETGIQLALRAILVSPHFLFKVELPDLPGGGDITLNEFQLAASLSYFLWSSMPDDELFRLAWRGELRKDDHLEQQVRRMLADEKSQALVENFAGQWLNLRNLETVTPDPLRFPTFDDRLRDAMRRETEMFFASIARDNRSLLDLLAADYTFVNETLARHYGIPGVAGDRFRRVSLAGTRRGGLLTHASVLTVTSNPTRTSPVKRGKWVLDNLLGEPPPPPAPDAMPLEDQTELTGTLRQQMQQHRSDPRCITCHEKMDPLGFALEHFDAIGRWRNEDDALPIDASGELPNGEQFDGARELQKLLITSRRDAFVRCISEKMLTYALGRGLEYYDKCAVDKIVAALAENDNRFERLVLEITGSDPFQRRRIQQHRSPQ